MDEDQVLEVLRAINDPHTGRDIVTEGFVQDLVVDGDRISFVMRPPPGEDHCPQYVPLAVHVKRAVMGMPGVAIVKATFTCHLQERAVNQALDLLDEMEGRS